MSPEAQPSLQHDQETTQEPIAKLSSLLDKAAAAVKEHALPLTGEAEEEELKGAPAPAEDVIHEGAHHGIVSSGQSFPRVDQRIELKGCDRDGVDRGRCLDLG